MPKWHTELPQWTEKFKTADTITPGEAAQLRTDIGRLGDRHLAVTYNELSIPYRTSILADVLEQEIIDRYLTHNLVLAFS